MNEHFVIINGELIEKSKASLSITDLSIQRGYGIFDFLKTSNHQPVFLDDHLDRFYASAKEMSLSEVPNRKELKELIFILMKKNNIPDSGIRLTLTGGYSADGYQMATPNLIITQSPLSQNKNDFQKGIHLVTYEHQRQLPQVKTIDYLFAIYLQPFINKHDANEVLYHRNSEITECPRANFFMVKDDETIVTPAKDILKGITRKKILASNGFNIQEGVCSLKDLESAREAFITSTTKCVMPVTQINGKPVGAGVPGKITLKVNAMMQNLYNLSEG